MKEYKFKGLDRKANIKAGIVIAFIIIMITSIGFYFFHDHIKSYFLAVFFILSHGFIAVTIFMLFIARFLNGEWLIRLYENHIEIYYNEILKKEIKYEDIQSVLLASSNKTRRYLKIVDSKDKKTVVQIQYFPYMRKTEMPQFDNFSSNFTIFLKPLFLQKESINQGYKIINFYKNN